MKKTFESERDRYIGVRVCARVLTYFVYVSKRNLKESFPIFGNGIRGQSVVKPPANI